MALLPRLARLLAAAALAGALASPLPGCRENETDRDLRDIEKSYYALRDAILQGDDEAFFAMHSEEARRYALANFPAIRAGYLASSPAEKEAFERKCRITSKEFLEGEPRAIVVRMMPIKSGWRENKEMFRTAVVRDVKIDHLAGPGGTQERVGFLVLEPREAGGGRLRPEEFPQVAFVHDPDGWRRRAFFEEVVHLAGPPVGPPGRREK